MLLHDLAVLSRILGYLSDLKLAHMTDFVHLYREYQAEVGFEENYYAQMAIAEQFYPRSKAFKLTSPLHTLVEFHRLHLKYKDEGVSAL